MTGDTSHLSSYTADALLREFDIPDPASIQAISLRYLFKRMAEEIPRKDLSRMRHNKFILEAVKDKVNFRYALYGGFIENFVETVSDFGKFLDEDALIAAVICDGEINRANEPLPDEEIEEYGLPKHTVRDDGFDDGVLCRACIIWEQACELSQGTRSKEEIGRLASESLFLAHINAMGALAELEEYFDTYDQNELLTFRHVTIPAIRSFTQMNTDIGYRLAKFCDIAQERIVGELEPILRPSNLQNPRLGLPANNNIS